LKTSFKVKSPREGKSYFFGKSKSPRVKEDVDVDSDTKVKKDIKKTNSDIEIDVKDDIGTKTKTPKVKAKRKIAKSQTLKEESSPVVYVEDETPLNAVDRDLDDDSSM